MTRTAAVRGRLDYARRVGGVAWRDPREFVDRARGQWEVRRERTFPVATLAPSAHWVDGFHDLLDLPGSCQLCTGFDRVWVATEATLDDTGHVTGKGYDAGIDLARAAYAAIRHLRPRDVVETGVARGVTSRVILEAMLENGSGRLHSIDLPPLSEGWHAQSAIAVPPGMATDWDLRRGASRRMLPRLLAELGSVPMFVHDSLHTYANMTWEMETVWPHLEPGGLLLCDDVEDNRAFEHFTARTAGRWVVGKEERRRGLVGAIRSAPVVPPTPQSSRASASSRRSPGQPSRPKCAS